MKVSLQPCKIRENRIVPLKAERIDLRWHELVAKMAPNREPFELNTLAQLRLGSYVGVCRRSRGDGQTVFMLMNDDRSGFIDWILKKDETFASRVIEVYRVDALDSNAQIIETEAS